MDIPEDLLCLYSAEVTEQGGSYVIEIPDREVTTGTLGEGDTYRVAMLPSQATDDDEESTRERPEPQSEQPVSEGDVVDVEIEDIGEQGDGIARVGPGYVVIVPDAKMGERVSVEVNETRENVAFAEVLKRYDSIR
ncbi:MAG: putative RNA-binding protein with TRAM domain [Haloarculaceae archaeon]|jgi:predicted RNA-binding protein with TRAM domain